MALKQLLIIAALAAGLVACKPTAPKVAAPKMAAQSEVPGPPPCACDKPKTGAHATATRPPALAPKPKAARQMTLAGGPETAASPPSLTQSQHAARQEHYATSSARSGARYASHDTDNGGYVAGDTEAAAGQAVYGVQSRSYESETYSESHYASDSGARTMGRAYPSVPDQPGYGGGYRQGRYAQGGYAGGSYAAGTYTGYPTYSVSRSARGDARRSRAEMSDYRPQ